VHFAARGNENGGGKPLVEWNNQAGKQDWTKLDRFIPLAIALHSVIPAQAGIHAEGYPLHQRGGDMRTWIPACAGMT